MKSRWWLLNVLANYKLKQWNEKYQTLRTVPKSNRQIVEREEKYHVFLVEC
jgi:hypothetical protein